MIFGYDDKLNVMAMIMAYVQNIFTIGDFWVRSYLNTMGTQMLCDNFFVVEYLLSKNKLKKKDKYSEQEVE